MRQREGIWASSFEDWRTLAQRLWAGSPAASHMTWDIFLIHTSCLRHCAWKPHGEKELGDNATAEKTSKPLHFQKSSLAPCCHQMLFYWPNQWGFFLSHSEGSGDRSQVIRVSKEVFASERNLLHQIASYSGRPEKAMEKESGRWEQGSQSLTVWCLCS